MSETDRYILLLALDPEGRLCDIGDAGNAEILRVAEAAPRPGSLTERDLDSVTDHPAADIDSAIRDMFSRMRATGLPGVIDATDVRLHQPSPLGLCTAMTEHLWDLIDAENAENDLEGRADDFDAHDLSTVREAMVDNCPEYSGDSTSPEP